MATPTYFPISIPLSWDDARWALTVLSEASDRLGVAQEAVIELRPEGITLGRLTGMFASLLGPETQTFPFGTVLNLGGDRLYDVRLPLEAWGLLSAFLGEFIVGRMWMSGDNSLAEQEAAWEAEQVSDLLNRIMEATP
ncbi:hypothetical protein [Amycolatopsis sp. NPDC003731]